MSRGRPRHLSSRRRMYSSRQRDVRERRAHQDWDAPHWSDSDATLDADEGREVEAQLSWGVQLHTRASAA